MNDPWYASATMPGGAGSAEKRMDFKDSYDFGDLNVMWNDEYDDLKRIYGTRHGVGMINVHKGMVKECGLTQMVGVILFNESLTREEGQEIRRHVQTRTDEPGHGEHWVFMPT